MRAGWIVGVGVAAGVTAICVVASAAPPSPSPPKYGMRLEEAWIPMPDGVRLAADLYLPAGGAEGERFPVLLEYLPYRKTESRDGTGRSSHTSSSADTSSRASTSAAPATRRGG